MSGDYSRRRFDPRKHYQGVLRQQGRVDLDADWNEYVDIQDRRWRAETIDVVGRCGVPRETPNGFMIDRRGADLTVEPGRIYVDGYLVENHGTNRTFVATIEEDYDTTEALPVKNQPYGGPVKIPDGVRSLVYLDVWRREVTPLQAPDLIEPAVNGDTTTRYQTVWQVKILNDIPPGITCITSLIAIPGWMINDTSSARLTTSMAAETTEPDPCLIPPTGGYRGLENHLYRVEVHSATRGSVKVKWSRDNAHVAARVLNILSTRTAIRVESLGRDNVLCFKNDDWVEITSDSREFAGLAGELRKVTVNQTDLTLSFSAELEDDLKVEDHLRVIRWDQKGIVRKPDRTELINLDRTSDGLIELTEASPTFMLEHGIQATLTFGTATFGMARPGDYWCFAARTADDKIELLKEAPPLGIHHHYCKLAFIEPNGDIHDCRPVYPMLTELTSLFYVSGDGQEELPEKPLPKLIQVGVANGKHPVVGARVRFRMINGNGHLNGERVGEAGIIVRTDSSGIASCNWTLGNDPRYQQVEATLADWTHLPVRFNATLAKSSDAESGIHVEKIEIGDQVLANDTEISVLKLLDGIQFTCDKKIDNFSIVSKPVCFVTVYMPFFGGKEIESKGVPAYMPLLVSGTVSRVSDQIFIWAPTDSAKEWLAAISLEIVKLKSERRLRVGLMLKGNFIWNADQSFQVYLDGEVFGVPHIGPGGQSNTSVVLPSGSRLRSSDLEMWFWLVPGKSEVEKLDISPPTAEIKVGESIVFTVAGPGWQTVTLHLEPDGRGAINEHKTEAGKWTYKAPDPGTIAKLPSAVAIVVRDNSGLSRAELGRANVTIVDSTGLPPRGKPTRRSLKATPTRKLRRPSIPPDE
jgi:hypothetical protein